MKQDSNRYNNVKEEIQQSQKVPENQVECKKNEFPHKRIRLLILILWLIIIVESVILINSIKDGWIWHEDNIQTKPKITTSEEPTKPGSIPGDDKPAREHPWEEESEENYEDLDS